MDDSEKEHTVKPPSPRIFVLSILLALLALDVRITVAVLGWQPLGLDWAPLWAASRISAIDIQSVYDFARVTRAQEHLIGITSGARPFIYPPSALAIIAPFSVIPVLPSYVVWASVTGAIYLAVSAKLTRRWWILPLACPFVLTAIAGQTTFLVGGLLILGLQFLEKRPAYAGIILGMATAIKPQTFILVPLALVLAQKWRPLAYWGASATGMVLLSLGLFGPDVWLKWFAALPRFQALVGNNPALVNNSITPYALAQRVGCAGWWVFVAGAGPAVASIWATFGTRTCTADRVVALVGGAVLLSPYAMNYELALIAPALLAGRTDDIKAAALILVLSLSLLFGFGFGGIILAMAPVIVRPLRRIWPRNPKKWGSKAETHVEGHIGGHALGWAEAQQGRS